MKVFGFNITKDEPINQIQEVVDKKIVDYPLLQQKLRTREDIRKWENAIDLAENVVSYNREDMHRIYNRVLDDPMLHSQWETRKLKSLDKEFRLTVNGEENEDATEIFEAGWFMEYMRLMLDAKLFGFTLVEFGAIEDNKFVKWRTDDGLIRDAVQLIDRDHVKPELGIVTEQPGDSTGLDITEDEYNEWLIFEGGADYGLMKKIARYMLFKENVLGNWSEWAEVFGMDMRVGKTPSQGQDRKDFVKALRDLGANGSGVFDEDDTVEFVGVNRQDAYKVYLEFSAYIDEQIAKLILGQDVVSNNTGQVVGTVGENISNLYGDTDAKFVQRNVNDLLIPLMIDLGFTGLDNAMFEWDTTEQLNLNEKSEIDLRISQMGFNLDQEYIEDTYGTKLNEQEPVKLIPEPFQPIKNIKAELDKLYG